MPEGPEVKRLVDYLNKRLKNERLLKMTINNGRYKRKKIENYNDFIKTLPIRIKSVKSKGKFIYIEFHNNFVLFITLGLSGYLHFKRNNIIEKHDNITFYFKDFYLYFNDYRNFGTIRFKKQEDLQDKLNKLGVDILDKNPDLDLYLKRIRNKNQNNYIAKVLLNQTVISGVGNYLRADGLYLAKISPYRKLKDLTDEELLKLFNILQILSWFKYDEIRGRKLGIINNKYINNYDNFLVYMNDNINGNKIIREKLGDRTIHYTLSQL